MTTRPSCPALHLLVQLFVPCDMSHAPVQFSSSANFSWWTLLITCPSSWAPSSPHSCQNWLGISNNDNCSLPMRGKLTNEITWLSTLSHSEARMQMRRFDVSIGRFDQKFDLHNHPNGGSNFLHKSFSVWKFITQSNAPSSFWIEFLDSKVSHRRDGEGWTVLAADNTGKSGIKWKSYSWRRCIIVLCRYYSCGRKCLWSVPGLKKVRIM